MNLAIAELDIKNNFGRSCFRFARNKPHIGHLGLQSLVIVVMVIVRVMMTMQHVTDLAFVGEQNALSDELALKFKCILQLCIL